MSMQSLCHPSTLGQSWSKVATHCFFIFLPVTQSIMSDRNKRREGSSLKLMVTREFQFFVVQKARLGTLSSVHIMVDQEPKLGHNLEESAPRDHTVTDCPKGYMHAHTCMHTLI